MLTEAAEPFPPLLRVIDTEDEPNRSVKQLYILYEQFKFPEVELSIGYKFANKAYLVQAFTHASCYKVRSTIHFIPHISHIRILDTLNLRTA